MTDEFTFILDEQRVTAQPGETIWQVARNRGIEIPSLCLSTEPDFRSDGNCRICMVEIEGEHQLQPSCTRLPMKDLRVVTRCQRAERSRELVMGLFLPRHRFDLIQHVTGWQRPWVSGKAASVFTSCYLEDDSHPGIAVALNACTRCARCVQACQEVELYDVIGLAHCSRSLIKDT